MIKIFLLFIVIVNFCCAKQESKNEASLDNIIKIRTICKNILNGDKVDQDTYHQLLMSFRKNEEVKIVYFPENESDNKSFFQSIQKISEYSETNKIAIEFIFQLSKVVRRNVEYSEYLMKLVPILMLHNPVGFIEFYHNLPANDKGIVLEDMEYLKWPEQIKSAKDKLNKIESSDLDSSIVEVKAQLQKIVKLYENRK